MLIYYLLYLFTSKGTDILLGQYMFMALYMAVVAVLLVIYKHSTKVNPKLICWILDSRVGFTFIMYFKEDSFHFCSSSFQWLLCHVFSLFSNFALFEESVVFGMPPVQVRFLLLVTVDLFQSTCCLFSKLCCWDKDEYLLVCSWAPFIVTSTIWNHRCC